MVRQENNTMSDKVWKVGDNRVTFPDSWTDEQKQQYVDKASVDMHLRRQLRVIKKDGSSQLLEHGGIMAKDTPRSMEELFGVMTPQPQTMNKHNY